MDELVAWYRAQLDEDEQVAREARQDALVWQAAPTGRYAPAGWIRAVNDEDSWAVSNDVSTLAQARHIALHGPARVLREVEAKRRILAAWEQRMEESVGHPRGEVFGYHATGLRIAIKHLATVYADRPGYREDWRP